MLFTFSIVTLSFNIIWIDKIRTSYRVWVLITINASILVLWILLFYLIDQFVFGIYNQIISLKITAIVYSFFLLVLVLISIAIRLIDKSKQDSLEKEVLKQKNLQNELEALRNQINPHFLFNSLNTLSLLVREDQKAAVRFINKLSFLYRYILQSQDKELVTVSEELKVLESYVHLIKQRFNENFKVNIRISEELNSSRIPILALQILMENAIKHNEISERNPLLVEVYNDDSWIVIKNVLQERKEDIESTHTGLKNLNTRVKLHMQREIKILKTRTHFIVKIPTL